MHARTPKALVMELVEEGFGRGDASVFERIVAEGYVQHNPSLPSGRAGLRAMLAAVQALRDSSFLPVRMIADSQYVVLHSDWRAEGLRRAVFDLFRVQDGWLIEHWDAMQDQPADCDLLAGTTEVGDRTQTPATVATVATFMEQLLAGHPAGDGDAMIDHGIPPLADTRVHYRRLHRLVGEGHFAFTQCEGRRAHEPVALYDLFRVSPSGIAERWNVTQAIPNEAANRNGIF